MITAYALRFFLFLSVLSFMSQSALGEDRGALGAEGGALGAEGAEGADCEIAKIAISSVSSLRGLKVKKPVECRLQSKKEVEKYLRSVIGVKIPKAKILAEGRVYAMLGMIPEDFDYLNGVIELYLSQLGGYYDPELDYYAMANWMPSSMQLPIAVHELTHALQDQHFDLGVLINADDAVSDSALAISALAEGDATAVMIDFTRGLAGQQSIAQDQNVSALMLQSISGALLSSGLKETPSSLQSFVLFPYISGLNFTHALLVAGGYQAVDRAFKNPPSSTEEILHPDIYLSKTKSYALLAIPGVPEGFALESSEPIFDDRMGEFGISVLLKNWISSKQAVDAAQGWGGDRLAYYKDESLEEEALIWEQAWDSMQDAEQFRVAVTIMFEKRKNSQGGKPNAQMRINRSGLRTKIEIRSSSH